MTVLDRSLGSIYTDEERQETVVSMDQYRRLLQGKNIRLDGKTLTPADIPFLRVESGEAVERHMGPSDHPSGSPQQVHAGDDLISKDLQEQLDRAAKNGIDVYYKPEDIVAYRLAKAKEQGLFDDREFPPGSGNYEPVVTEEEFLENWREISEERKADPWYVAKVLKQINNAVENYDVPSIPVEIRKPRRDALEENAGGIWNEMEPDGGGWITMLQGELAETAEKFDFYYQTDPSKNRRRQPLGAVTAPTWFPNILIGNYIHEAGHRFHDEVDPSSLDRAERMMVTDTHNYIPMYISGYATSNESELVAEAYALSKHPLYPDGMADGMTRRVREIIEGGNDDDA